MHSSCCQSLAWLLYRRRVEDARRSRLLVVAGSSYATLFGILLWQALRGQALISPDALTLVVLVVWATVTGVAAVWPFRHRSARPDADATLNWINP